MGGKDNITVVVVATAGYKPFGPEMEPTAALSGPPTTRRWTLVLGGLLIGAGLGFGAAIALRQFASVGPITMIVGPAGINTALNAAHPGDTVVIPPGRYRERVQLREGVALRAQQPDAVTLTSLDGGPAVVARKIESGSIEGVWVQGDPQSPGSSGIEIVDASPTISNDRVTGFVTGILIRGKAEPVVTSSQIENNLGAGILVEAGAKPKIGWNLIAANGDGKPGVAHPGVEVADSARPVLKNNGIVNNASEPVWIHGRAYQPADFEENFFGALTPRDALRLVDVPREPEEKPRPRTLKTGAKK
jgi:hypothetical protein